MIGAALVVSGGPTLLSRRTVRNAGVARMLRVIPYRIQVDQPPEAPPFALELVQALRTALFVSSAGPDDEVGADPGALGAPHLLLHVRPGRSEGYRLEAAVVRQPLGTLRADTLARCGRGNIVAAPPLEQGAAAGAHIAAYVECFRRFADSSARAE